MDVTQIQHERQAAENPKISSMHWYPQRRKISTHHRWIKDDDAETRNIEVEGRVM